MVILSEISERVSERVHEIVQKCVRLTLNERELACLPCWCKNASNTSLYLEVRLTRRRVGGWVNIHLHS